MNKEQLYAIIDGASEEELMPMLAEFDPPAACLYAPPVQPDLVDIAPYVVLVDDDVKEWLDARETPWGIYITTTEDLKTIRQHLRKYLYVRLPDDEKPVFFRFYDPRNIWLLTSALSDWELHSFMGPINRIQTTANGEQLVDDFAERRSEFPRDAVSNQLPLELTEEQVEIMNGEFEARLIKKMSVIMQEEHEKLPAAVEAAPIHFDEFADRLFSYLKKEEIQDIETVKTVSHSVACLGFNSFDNLPDKFFEISQNDGTPGWSRAEKACAALEE